MGLTIPLPTDTPENDPAQYIPLLLSAIEGFLLAPDIWAAADYPSARQHMEHLMSYIVGLMEGQSMSNPVGATMQWHMATAPAGWLLCQGQSVLKASYPKLFAVWGTKYGGDSTHFTILDMREKSPIGAGTLAALDAVAGAATVTLGLTEIPAHSHAVKNRNQVSAFFHTGVAGANASIADTVGTTNSATANTTQNAGSGAAHNNLSPVKGVNFIVFAGV